MQGVESWNAERSTPINLRDGDAFYREKILK